jgi:hypothetical protein
LITHPKAEELTQAVSRWIDGVRPSLDTRNAFLARVAVNILGVIVREQNLGPAAEAAARARFAELLGHEGDYADLNRELCARLRAGELDAETPGLLAALKANVLDQIAIDQPNYRHEGLAGGAP